MRVRMSLRAAWWCVCAVCRLLVSVSLACLSVVVVVGTRTATLGVLFSRTGGNAFLGRDTRRTAELWLDQLQTHIRTTGGIADTDIVPEIVFCDVESSPAGTLACLAQLMANYTLSCVVAPEDRLAELVAPVTDASGIPVIASVSGLTALYLCDDRRLSPCRRSTGRRFQTLIANGITVSQAPLGLFPYLRSYGAASVAVIATGDSAYLQEAANATVNDAARNHVRLLLHAALPSDAEAVSAGAYSHVVYTASVAIVAQLRALDPDIIVWLSRPHCREMIDAF